MLIVLSLWSKFLSGVLVYFKRITSAYGGSVARSDNVLSAVSCGELGVGYAVLNERETNLNNKHALIFEDFIRVYGSELAVAKTASSHVLEGHDSIVAKIGLWVNSRGMINGVAVSGSELIVELDRVVADIGVFEDNIKSVVVAGVVCERELVELEGEIRLVVDVVAKDNLVRDLVESRRVVFIFRQVVADYLKAHADLRVALIDLKGVLLRGF